MFVTEQPKAHPAHTSRGITRRRFVERAIAFMWGTLGISYLAAALGFNYPMGEQETKLEKVGTVDDFLLNQPKLVTYHGQGVPVGVFVTRKPDGFLALDHHCTHLECPVKWTAATKSYSCPCHGSTFDADGNNIGGPAPKPLKQRVVKVEGNDVYVGGLLA